MSSVRKHTLHQTWRAITARPRPTVQRPIFHHARATATCDGTRWHSTATEHRRVHQHPRSSDPIPFPHRDQTPSNATISNDGRATESQSTSLTDRERGAFSRLIDLSTAPALSSSNGDQTESLPEMRRSPQERDDEVLALLRTTVPRTRRTQSDHHVPWDSLVESLPSTAEPLAAEKSSGTEAVRSVEGKPSGLASGVPHASELPPKEQEASSVADTLPFPPTNTEADRNAATQISEHLDAAMALSNSGGHAQVQATETASPDPWAEARERQYSHVATAIRDAKTDHQIWAILDTMVFSKIKDLDLDRSQSEENSTPNVGTRIGPKKERKRKKRRTLKTKSADPTWPEERRQLLSTVALNYSPLLHLAARELRQRFPGSTLAFSILPTIKALGRSSYVLGANTGLYNELISATYTMYCDFNTINALLIEMENAGLEFDQDTLDILNKIRMEGNYMKRVGKEKLALKLFWATDIHQGGWRKVIAWVPIIRERLQVAEARRAEEMRAVQAEGQMQQDAAYG